MKLGKRKYWQGNTPCGVCQSGRHVGCRPRLDGKLCSCTCPRAAVSREEFDRKVSAARAEGRPVPEMAEALEMLHPRWKQRTSKLIAG